MVKESDQLDLREENGVKDLIFFVNGQKRVIKSGTIDSRMTLAVYLRDHLRLTGTKIGCNEGGCGACTVMISDQHPLRKELRHYSVNACLMPICAVFGKAITTVEGISTERALHPVQERLAKCHGSQCGYCTPGFVMAMYSLLRNHPKPSIEQIDDTIQGNLCRCTGYRPILEAFYSFAEKLKLTDLTDCAKYDPTQELLFPSELKINNLHQQSFVYESNQHFWFQPTTLHHLLALKRKYPNARIVSGNSEVGVEQKWRFVESKRRINPKQIPELNQVELLSDSISIGAALSLSEVTYELKLLKAKLAASQCGVIDLFLEMMPYFAGKHIRNVATIAGNIITASPISDLNPIWMATGAKLVLQSESSGVRVVDLDENFFVGYRRTTINQEEIVKAILLPLSKQNEHLAVYKQAQRRDDDIAIVTGAFKVKIDPVTKRIENISIAYGGMAPVTKFAKITCETLQKKKFERSVLDFGMEKLREEFALSAEVPGGMPRYRQALALSFFFKFYLKTMSELENKVEEKQLHSESLKATQLYQEVPKDQNETDAVGKPMVHQSGFKHTTGKAIYTTDVIVPDCLHGVLVLAPITFGTLHELDPSEALKLPGVVQFYSASDLPDKKLGFVNDTPVFVSEEISYYCQPVGMILAEDHETARRAANLVKVRCTEKPNPILTIEEALSANAFMGPQFKVLSQMSEGKEEHEEIDWSKYDRVVKGECRTGAQEHFYLETQNCIAIPLEDDEIEMVVSTQGVSDIQSDVSKILGIPKHKIFSKVRRVGGAFGGKEAASSLCAVPAAFAAMKLRRPVRFYLERYDDMAITGTRHPFRFDYEAAISKDNKLLDLKVHSYSNGGFSEDLSLAVATRAIVSMDSVYKIKNADLYAQVLRTNLASSTAFRGFGAPQGMFCMETVLKHLAEKFDLDVDQFREDNMYKEGEMTPCGMILYKCNARRTWTECKEFSKYEQKKEEVKLFNSQNEFKKRGVYMVSTKFGIGMGEKPFLNQAGCLILVYCDGSVLISHAGMEMGQGLHIKILQIASRCLNIPIEMIHIQETSSDKVPNTTPTVASLGSDLNGEAVKDACSQLLSRLKPYMDSNPTGKWVDWVVSAYFDRVLLSATGMGRNKCDPINFETGKGGKHFAYCVYGTACCVAEVDCLTGDHRLLSTDIVMDIGDSINPAIDIGQIEGAFTQGYGLFTMEEIKVRPNGMRLTRGPGVYKIPSADDAPCAFNVSLLRDSGNPYAIFASKAVGEPPLFLGSAAFFAIREAVRAYRIQNGRTDYFSFDAPATPERIRMACEDVITEKIPQLPPDNTYTPWTVTL
ncbi:unnamed protein product, partial [Mesorhabditis belari]|uniref:xanthine dehydrogenase n=1 Tax=Mesorhabditis belari TaxID=2138241 RepID=A0AAF3FIB6_9BILA